MKNTKRSTRPNIALYLIAGALSAAETPAEAYVVSEDTAEPPTAEERAAELVRAEQWMAETGITREHVRLYNGGASLKTLGLTKSVMMTRG